MTDANVGARKKQNICDNLFVVYAILNSAKRGNKETLDVCAYDAEKCFDALWTYECVNDLFEAGLQNDKLSLLFEINQSEQVDINILWNDQESHNTKHHHARHCVVVIEVYYKHGQIFKVGV